MPILDWTRVEDGVFHSFHNAWISELCKALNAGLLPPDHYALGEQIAGSIGPDVLTLQAAHSVSNGVGGDVSGAVAVAVAPPKVQRVVQSDVDPYVLKQRTLVIRHISGHRIVAMIEIVSPGNKASTHALRTFRNKVIAALAQGIHLLLLDLHPPGPRDPQGIHAVIWKKLTGKREELPIDRPLTLVAYTAGPVSTAYVEPTAVGLPLIDMPLFLTADQYINVVLERTYQSAYEGVPRFYRDVLEAPAASAK